MKIKNRNKINTLMRGILKYLGYSHLSSVKHKTTPHSVKMLLLMLLEIYLPATENTNKCFKND